MIITEVDVGMQAKEGFYGRANDFEQITNISSPSSLRRTHAVAHHELWYRYVPESGNWHGGTLTRWMAALSAAPLSLFFPTPLFTTKSPAER